MSQVSVTRMKRVLLVYMKVTLFCFCECVCVVCVCTLPHRWVILYLFSASLNPQYSIWTCRLGQGTARLCDFSGAFRINEYIWLAAEQFPSMPRTPARRRWDRPDDGRRRVSQSSFVSSAFVINAGAAALSG